jgi:mannosyltransferase
MQSPPARSRLSWPLVLLAVLSILGAVLRLWQARESLWIDELHTAWCALGDWSQVAPRARIGNQSPLFFWLQWLLVRGLGASEITMRLPSLVAGSLLPAAVFVLARCWTASSWLGLVAAALVVADPLSIYYATEARPYALVQLLAVGHVGVVFALVEQPTAWRRAAFVLGAALLFHLHYTAALVLVAELVLLLPWSMQREARYPLRHLALDLALIAVLCLPAVLHLGYVFGRRENWASFVPQTPLDKLFDVLPWSAAAGYVAAALILSRFFPLPRDGNDRFELHRRGALLVLAWLLVPLALTWLTTATDLARLFFHRYLIASAPAAAILAAATAALAPSRWGRAVVATAMAAAAGWSLLARLPDDGRIIRARGEDWRTAVAWLNEQLAEHPDPVLLRSGFIESRGLRQPHAPLLEDYCLLPLTSLYVVRAERADLVPLPSQEPWRIDDALAERLNDRGGAWLVVRTGRRSGADIAAEQLARRLERRGGRQEGGRSTVDRGREEAAVAGPVAWRVERARSFGGVHVFSIRREAVPPSP